MSEQKFPSPLEVTWVINRKKESKIENMTCFRPLSR